MRFSGVIFIPARPQGFGGTWNLPPPGLPSRPIGMPASGHQIIKIPTFEEIMDSLSVRLSVHRRVIMLAFSILTSAAVPAMAQSASVNGTIKDPDQSVVSNAAVTLSNAATGQSLQGMTDATGRYSFAAVAAGTYRLEAHKDGFEPAAGASIVV